MIKKFVAPVLFLLSFLFFSSRLFSQSNTFDSTVFIQQGGFYENEIDVELNTDYGDIYFTTNGSVPDLNSKVYSEPIPVTETTVIRARVLIDGILSDNTETHTFFINEKSSLPIFSLSTKPENFWDPDSGIYVEGNNYNPDSVIATANFWKDWEKPIHVEFYESDKSLAFKQDAGVKIFGSWSRTNRQKSLALHAREEYGTKKFYYPLFPDSKIAKYKKFVLRNSGTDWGVTMFRDGFMQSLMKNQNLDILNYRPAIVFLNGKYWGIHNIREKVSDNYIGEHYPNVDKDNIDLLETYSLVIRGDNNDYLSLLEFIKNNDLSDTDSYRYVENKIDIDNFITYEVFEIFIDNTDWPANNIKFWKPKTNDGKWRWILLDTDFGFDLFNNNAFEHNTLDFATSTDTTIDYPNPAWSTFLLRNLLKNETFKNKFVNKFADFSNTIFQPEYLLNKIDEVKNGIDSEIERHIQRWGGGENDYDDWITQIDVMKNFANNRLSYITSYFVDRFNLESTNEITLDISDKNAGEVFINNLKIENFSWSGNYFSNIPIILSAKANSGYKFVGWEGDYESDENNLEIYMDENKSITAVFEKINDFPDIVINEINYDSNPNFDTGDWVELYNNSVDDIEISNWVFKDSKDKHQFIIPENIVLASNDFIVLCKDTSAFKNLFPNQENYNVPNYIGNFDFGLSSGGELIRLFDANGNLIDNVSYGVTSPWPSEPKGNGVTLELINPDLDNSKPENWGISNNHGTPGNVNDSYVLSTTKRTILFKFKLKQNYPNPFNPTTTIQYTIPNREKTFHSASRQAPVQNVKLKVYDILGREVTTLVNKQQKPGVYKVTFDAANLSSGIYYYRLTSGNFSDVRKMILLK